MLLAAVVALVSACQMPVDEAEASGDEAEASAGSPMSATDIESGYMLATKA